MIIFLWDQKIWKISLWLKMLAPLVIKLWSVDYRQYAEDGKEKDYC